MAADVTIVFGTRVVKYNRVPYAVKRAVETMLYHCGYKAIESEVPEKKDPGKKMDGEKKEEELQYMRISADRSQQIRSGSGLRD